MKFCLFGGIYFAPLRNGTLGADAGTGDRRRGGGETCCSSQLAPFGEGDGQRAVEDISGSRRIYSLDTIGRNELLAPLIGNQRTRTAHRNDDTPYTAPAKPCGGRNGIADILDFQPRQQLRLAAVRPTLRPQSAPQGPDSE